MHATLLSLLVMLTIILETLVKEMKKSIFYIFKSRLHKFQYIFILFGFLN
jgi:hypothetical protein